VGFEVASLLAEQWQLPKAQKRYGGLLTEGRIGPGMPRVTVLLPQTFMNESGRAVGPARGEYRLDLDQVVAVHDEIDLPFGDVRERKGGGTAGHNGIKSLKESLGSGEFWRVRVGVGRPDTTDPEVVSQHVLSRFTEPASEVRRLIERAADETERLLEREYAASEEPD
jgi:PTH1 family peptidyl-tRNA hydrolase